MYREVISALTEPYISLNVGNWWKESLSCWCVMVQILSQIWKESRYNFSINQKSCDLQVPSTVPGGKQTFLLWNTNPLCWCFLCSNPPPPPVPPNKLSHRRHNLVKKDSSDKSADGSIPGINGVSAISVSVFLSLLTARVCSTVIIYSPFCSSGWSPIQPPPQVWNASQRDGTSHSCRQFSPRSIPSSWSLFLSQALNTPLKDIHIKSVQDIENEVNYQLALGFSDTSYIKCNCTLLFPPFPLCSV